MPLSCWVHERKHNMLERYCQHVFNTWIFEESVLGEVTVGQLNEQITTPGLGINQGLEMPVHPDKQMCKCLLQHFPADPTTFRTSQTLRVSEFACCSKGDVVLMKDDRGFKATQILWVASVYDTCVALISAWDVITVTGKSAT